MLQQDSSDTGTRLATRIIALLLFVCAAYIARHAGNPPPTREAPTVDAADVADDEQGDLSDLVRPVRLSSATMRLHQRLGELPAADEKRTPPPHTPEDEFRSEGPDDVSAAEPANSTDRSETAPPSESFDPYTLDPWSALTQDAWLSFDSWAIDEDTLSDGSSDTDSDLEPRTPPSTPTLNATDGMSAKQTDAAPLDSIIEADAAASQSPSAGAQALNEKRDEDVTSQDVAATQDTTTEAPQDKPQARDQSTGLTNKSTGLTNKSTGLTNKSTGLTIRNPNKEVGKVQLTINSVPTKLQSGFMLQYPGNGPWQVVIQRGQQLSRPAMITAGTYTIREINGAFVLQPVTQQ